MKKKSKTNKNPDVILLQHKKKTLWSHTANDRKQIWAPCAESWFVLRSESTAVAAERDWFFRDTAQVKQPLNEAIISAARSKSFFWMLTKCNALVRASLPVQRFASQFKESYQLDVWMYSQNTPQKKLHLYPDQKLEKKTVVIPWPLSQNSLCLALSTVRAQLAR